MSCTKSKKEYKSTRGGYTVVELIVAVGLFVVVALISSSAFLGVVRSNQKSLAARTAMDNLSSALESMSRNIQTGFAYHCDSVNLLGTISAPKDCPNNNTGGLYLAFEGQRGNVLSSTDQVVYKLIPCTSISPQTPSQCGQILLSTNGGTSFFALTAAPPELTISQLRFRVYGAPQTDAGGTKQPRIVIVVFGFAGVGASRSDFHLQTTVSQRLPDFPP